MSNLIKRIQRAIKGRTDAAKSFGKNFAHYAKNPHIPVVGTSPEEQDARDWHKLHNRESVEEGFFGFGKKPPNPVKWEHHYTSGLVCGHMGVDPKTEPKKAAKIHEIVSGHIEGIQDQSVKNDVSRFGHMMAARFTPAEIHNHAHQSAMRRGNATTVINNSVIGASESVHRGRHRCDSLARNVSLSPHLMRAVRNTKG